MTIALAALLAFTFALAAAFPQLRAAIGPDAPGLWMKILLCITVLTLILRVANQAERLFRRPTPGIPLAPQGLPFELVHSHDPLPAIQARMEALPGSGSQLRLEKSAESTTRPRTDAFTGRQPWAAIGPLLTYAGPLLILAGLLWSSMAGWRASDIVLATGTPVHPAQAESTTLTLIEASGSGDERPAVLELARGTASSYFWLSYERPVISKGTWVVQRASGPALSVRAEAEGRTLRLQPLEASSAAGETLHLRFTQNESEQGFSVAERGLAFRVVSYESLPDRAITGPVFLVEGYRGSDATPQLSELVGETGAVEWEGVTLTLQRDRYVVVDLAAVPGWPVTLLGGLLLLAGAAVTAWAGMTRVWINAVADRDGTQVAVRVAAPAKGQDLVSRLAAALAVSGDASPEVTTASRGTVLEAWQASTLLRPIPAAIVLSGAAVLAGVSILGAAGSAPYSGAWTFMLRNALAGAGLAAWIPALAASFTWALRSRAPAEAVDPLLPPDAHGMRGRTGDPGRAVALAAFPLLTAALLLGGIGDLLAFATPWRVTPGELWVLAAWCMGAAYLHATSGWRPLRLPAWLPVGLAAATLAAGVAAVLAAASVLR